MQISVIVSHFSDSFHRSCLGGVESEQLAGLISVMSSVSLSLMHDKWVSEFDSSGIYTISSAQNLIDQVTLGTVDNATR